MTRQKFILIISTAFIIAVLHFVVSPYRLVSYDYNLKLGQISEKNIIAPFEFKIYKSDETIISEQEAAASKVRSVYKVSENLKYNAQKNLDFILIDNESENMRDKLSKSGYNLSPETIEYLSIENNRLEIYNYLTEILTKIFNIGIFPENFSYREIQIARGNKIRNYHLSRLYSLEEAKEKLIENVKSDEKRKALQELGNIILIENIIIDNEITKLEKQKAKEKVSLTMGKVLRNEKIVSKNQKITATELLKLNSLLRNQKEQGASKTDKDLIISSFGIFLFSLFLLLVFYYILQLFFSQNFHSFPRLIVIAGCFLISIILTIFVNNVFEVPSLLIPFSFSVLLIALIFNSHIGIIFNFFNLIFISLFLNWSFINPAILSLSALGGIIAIKQMKKKQEYYPITIYLIISFIIMNTAISLIRFNSLSNYFSQLLFGILSCGLSIIGLILITPLVERKLNMATKQILLELLDFDNPLMKKMSVATPGTYHHSLIVGNLAESAAESIGADYLLARVGSYYHDIGKIENPQFFIENNPDASELHDKMLANESAILIRNHIANGIALAKKNKLPKPIIDIIQQHHGKSQIRYFYNKARETNLEIDKEQFYYSGPKPQTKEAAIVMIADIVESTTKSLDDFSEKKMVKVLEDTIFRLITEGQLDETPITLKELNTISTQMLPIIMGIYRKRLEYPET